MDTKNLSGITSSLKGILKNEPDTIRAFVAKEALEHDSIDGFFKDLAKGGCMSGMVNSLIYYADTHAFYDRFYDEIEDIRLELVSQELMGQVADDWKNHMAWLAFEQTAWDIANELGIDL